MTKAIAMMFATLLVQGQAAAAPTAILPGLGDKCDNPGMQHFTKAIAEGTGAYAACIDFAPSIEASLLVGMEKQVAIACAQLKQDGNFNSDFNLIGVSQGGLIARGMVERGGDMPGKVLGLISIGAPQAGTAEVPDCFNGRFCGVMNFGHQASGSRYFRTDYEAQAGNRWVHHDKLREYMAGSTFLADLNNEQTADSETAAVHKKRFCALQGVMLVEFSQDSVIYPRETAWFKSIDKNTKHRLTMGQSKFYTDDYIGLRELDEAGKVAWVELKGDHLEFSQSDIENNFIRFLNSRRLVQQESGVQAKAVMV